MKFTSLLILIIACGGVQLAAQTYAGQVLDAQTLERLPFVSIQLVGSNQGTFSDLDGNFQLKAHPGDSLRFSYVGYASHTQMLEQPTQTLRVALQPVAAILDEVVVRPGENPAWRIIRAALANRKQHDPRNYKGYQYRGYRKTVLRVDTLAEGSPRESRRKPKPVDPEKFQRDSLRQALFLHDMHLWLTETVSQHYFRAPNRYKENILRVQSSMPADLTQGINPITFQPFGFYQPRIRLEFTRQDYVNPISPGCFNHYDFQLIDTLYQGLDTTFVIQFGPLSNTNFTALEGLLHINSYGYAIENVIAEPADTNQLLDFKIRQQSSRLEEGWFPKVLDTELFFRMGEGDAYVQYAFGNRTYIEDPQLEIPPDSVFNQYRVERMVDTVQLVDSLRGELLTQREQNTYTYWDSLTVLRGPRQFLGAYNRLVGALASGVWGADKLQLVVLDLLRFNRWEKLRPGLGLRTGPSFSERFSAYGYAGYGLRDHAWKYALSGEVQLSSRRDLRLRLSHRHDLAVPGQLDWLEVINNPWSDFSARNLSRDRLDTQTEWRLEGIWRPHRAWQFNPYYAREERRPNYTYAYQETESLYHTLSLGLRLRWSPREQLAQMGQWEAVLFPNFPILDVQFSHREAEEVQGAWWQAALRLQHEFRSSYLGYTQIHLQAGVLSRDVPYPYLFQTEGGNVFFQNNGLQTAGLTEFTNQYYSYLFFTHRFGPLLGQFNTPYSRPELSLMHNLAWGQLTAPTNHQELALQDLRHLFLESGVRVDNIVRIPYFQFCYIGLGGSAFYRWGAYHLPKWWDNWAFQFTVKLSV